MKTFHFLGIRNQYLAALLTISLVSGVCFFTRDALDYKVTAYVLLATVSILAIFLSLLPILLAAVVSALILDFFFIKPYYTFHINGTEDALLFALFFVVALVNGVLTNRIRRVEHLAQIRDTRAANMRLYNTILDSLSHELRTPLASVIGSVELLKDNVSGEGQERQQELVTEIESAALRLERQVANLLNVSRLESGYLETRPDWCDLAEIAYKVVDGLAPDADRTVRILQPDYLPLFKLDYGLMEHILQNLISNALTYTPKGATVDVEIEYRPTVHFDDSETDEPITCVVRVSDDGHGFPENEIAHVFRKFYRIGTQTGGVGLGLSIVKGFVEAQQGTIALRNREKGGAEFTLSFPAPVLHTKTIADA